MRTLNKPVCGSIAVRYPCLSSSLTINYGDLLSHIWRCLTIPPSRPGQATKLGNLVQNRGLTAHALQSEIERLVRFMASNVVSLYVWAKSGASSLPACKMLSVELPGTTVSVPNWLTL